VTGTRASEERGRDFGPIAGDVAFVTWERSGFAKGLVILSIYRCNQVLKPESS
jgi:hypothetical protein